MGTNLEDDFTPEEKELLKREARYRIEQQRRREAMPIWLRPRDMPWQKRGSISLFLVGLWFIVLGLYFHFKWSSPYLRGTAPIELGLIAVGIVCVVLGSALLYKYWR